MENAAKALLMAGGVLIAILVLSSLVLLFSNLQNYQNKTDASTLDIQIAKYNSQYEPYHKDGLTLMELKSVYNKIVSNNNEHPEYKIDSNIIRGGIDANSNIVKSWNKPVYEYMEKDFSKIPDDQKNRKRFNCTGIEYNGKNERISMINFKDATPPSSESLIHSYDEL